MAVDAPIVSSVEIGRPDHSTEGISFLDEEVVKLATNAEDVDGLRDVVPVWAVSGGYVP